MIHPRPNIEVKRIIDIIDKHGSIEKGIVLRDNFFDDDMNVILMNYSPKDVLTAIYDRNIILKIDLTLKKITL